MSWTPLRRSLAGEGAMVGADLTDANLYGATLTEVDLSDANLAGGNLRAVHLTNVQRFDAAAVFPGRLTWPSGRGCRHFDRYSSYDRGRA